MVQDLKSPLSVWLQKSKADVRSAHAKVISDRLPSYFPLALNNEWGKNYQDYDIFMANIRYAILLKPMKEIEHGYVIPLGYKNK